MTGQIKDRRTGDAGPEEVGLFVGVVDHVPSGHCVMLGGSANPGASPDDAEKNSSEVPVKVNPLHAELAPVVVHP